MRRLRYKMGCAYIGSSFGGFTKSSSHLPSVTDYLESALSRFFGDGATFDRIQVSSRTDRGVHAQRNVFHVDIMHNSKTEKKPDLIGLVDGLNFFLSKNERYRNSSHNRMSNNDNDDDDDGYEGDTVNYRNRRRLRDIVITDVEEVSHIFDARRSAKSRTYKYHILCPTLAYQNRVRKNDKQRMKDGAIAYSMDGLLTNKWMFNAQRYWVLPFALDIEAMQQAAKVLVGTHDFSSFRNAGCQSISPIRSIHQLDVTYTAFNSVHQLTTPSWVNNKTNSEYFSSEVFHPYEEDDEEMGLVTITVNANSFVLRMVRNIVAVLVKVGSDRMQVDDMQTLLDAKSRAAAKCKPAPPQGLYLFDVHY